MNEKNRETIHMDLPIEGEHIIPHTRNHIKNLLFSKLYADQTIRVY